MSGKPVHSAGADVVARTRIRVFSLGVWVIGLVAIVVLAWTTLPQFAPPGVRADVESFFRGGPDVERVMPRDIRDTAPELVWDGALEAGAKGGYVVLPGGSQALELTVKKNTLLRLYQQRGTDPQGTGEVRYAGYASPMPEVIVTDAEPSLLWFMPTEEPWSATLREMPTTTSAVARVARGIGPAVVKIPDGPGGALLTHDGGSNFIARVVRFGDSEPLVNAIGRWDGRVAWSGEGAGYLWIEFADGVWSATFDDVPEAPTTPVPSDPSTPSDTSTPTGAADPRRAGRDAA